MRTLWDGVTASNIPTNAEIVAGYVEGRYVWSQADWNRFPNSIKLTIAIWNADADILDIETGDATSAMGPAWVRRQRERGAFPTVYCNRSTWPAVQSALAGAGFSNGQHYDLWLADYTQTPHCPPYAAACQYADPGPYDLSLCQDYWPRGAQDMTPEEHAKLYQLDDILRLLLFGGAPAYVDPSGNPAGWSAPDGKGHLTRVAEVMLANQAAQLSAQGVEKAEVDAMLAAVKAPVAVDVEKLATLIAAKLPPGSAAVDTKALATAVVNEIGVRVRPA